MLANYSKRKCLDYCNHIIKRTLRMRVAYYFTCLFSLIMWSEVIGEGRTTVSQSSPKLSTKGNQEPQCICTCACTVPTCPVPPAPWMTSYPTFYPTSCPSTGTPSSRPSLRPTNSPDGEVPTAAPTTEELRERIKKVDLQNRNG